MTKLKSRDKVISFNRFLFQADILSKSIGLVPYDKPMGKRFHALLNWIFFVNMINMNFVLISEIIFVILAIKNSTNFVEATMNLSYIGFVFVGDIKIISVLKKKPLLTELMKEIESIYPMIPASQRHYKIKKYLSSYNLQSLGFVIIHEILIWSYNLYIAMSVLIYEFWLETAVIPRNLPYFCWVPWQWQGHWSYYIMYFSQNLAGHTCMSGQLANDLMLCVLATQIGMHFEYLAMEIENFKPTGCADEDEKFLSKIIAYHQTILELSNKMNDVFGLSLLVNFLSSIFIMCFLGFQLTIGVQPDTLVMLFLFLLCSLVQIFMICNYGQELIRKSERIGHAAYNHQWIKANLKYRKMMILIIERSQKPALIKATTFLNVSMGTMTDILQISYKFFALIRTIYSK